MLRSVVLPAPLGPITDISSPCRTSRLTRLTAWTPPNDFETSWMESWTAAAPRGAVMRCPASPGPDRHTYRCHHDRWCSWRLDRARSTPGRESRGCGGPRGARGDDGGHASGSSGAGGERIRAPASQPSTHGSASLPSIRCDPPDDASGRLGSPEGRTGWQECNEGMGACQGFCLTSRYLRLARAILPARTRP